MSERMSTRRERKQTSKAEANSEAAAAPAKEKAEKVDRRQSGGGASVAAAAASSVPGPGKPAPEKAPEKASTSKQQAAPKQESKQEAKPPPPPKEVPIVKAACHTPAPRAKRLKTEKDDEPRASSIALAPTLPMQIIAGTGTADFMDGPLPTSCLRGPMGLAVDAEGNVLIADSDNRRIRMICRAVPSGGAAAVTPPVAGAPPTADAAAPAAAAPAAASSSAAPAASGAAAAEDLNGAAGPLDFERVRTLAGCGKPGCQDGMGRSATFTDPSGMAVVTKGDRAGTCYVSDAGRCGPKPHAPPPPPPPLRASRPLSRPLHPTPTLHLPAPHSHPPTRLAAPHAPPELSPPPPRPLAPSVAATPSGECPARSRKGRRARGRWR